MEMTLLSVEQWSPVCRSHRMFDYEVVAQLLSDDNLLYPLHLLCALGTMNGAMMLLKEAKADILEGVVVLELCNLKGRDKIPLKIFSLIPFSD